MAVAFRNLDFDPTRPLAQWPSEAILTLIERGTLADWRRLNAEIHKQPWGEVARKVEQALQVSQAYGATGLLQRAISRARDRAADRERSEVAAQIRCYLEESGLSRREFAERLGTSTSRLSTYLTGKVTPSATLLVRMRGLCPEGETSDRD